MPTERDLPESRVPWVPDPGRAVLLVHDMQRYFLRPFTPDRSPASELLHHCRLLRDRCAQLDVPVVYTAQPGDMDDEQRGLLKDFWGPGMRADAGDRQVVEELAPRPGDQVFTKWRYSALVRSGLLDLLRSSGRDQLILCGVYAHVGVLMTAVDAFSHDVQPFLVADAVADCSLGRHRLALTYAAQNCASVTTARSTLLALGAAGGRGNGARRASLSAP
ncbi:isochorismatase family protein [Streptomyces sp. K1PA1]|uniref:Isochorismatase family protein n=1 Tax=Streptomyces tropicalis TaxID=3034234 RepID=A0ABT6ABS8_9ACTN|nr:isochorismatase family protein [Streptomyces tropicalis]MDF3302109.1 isochorismatase family protein [Streptomyces tropicalis]